MQSANDILEKFYAQFTNIYGVLKAKYKLSEYDTEERVQQMFFNLSEKLHNMSESQLKDFVEEMDSPIKYLITCAKNETYTHLGREKKAEEKYYARYHEKYTPSNSYELEDTSESETWSDLERELPSREYRILRMSILEEKTNHEIAEEFNITTEYVYTIKSRAKKRAKAVLANFKNKNSLT